MVARRAWAILAVLVVAEIVSGFESSMMLAGLGAWMRIYGDPIGVGWIVTAYLLVQAAAAAVLGRLGDAYGRKRILILAIGGALGGSLISAFAPSLGWIVAGRAIQGLAGAILPLCFGLVREHLPAQKVPSGVGIIVASAAIASAGGVMIGGLLTDRFGPHSMFYASAGTALAALIIVAAFLPPSRSAVRPDRLDLLGGVLFVPAVTGLLLVVSNLSNWGLSPLTLGLGGASIALLIWWWIHERRHECPLIDVRLLANRRCLLANLVMACCAVGAMQITQVTSMMLQQPPSTGVGFGLSATFVGMLKLPVLILGCASSVWAGWASGRWTGRVPMIIGSGVMAVGLMLAALDRSSILIILIAILLTNAGTTAIYAGVPNVILAAAPRERSSEAVGLTSVIRAIFQAIGAQSVAVLLATSHVAFPGARTGFPADQAYILAFAFMALAALVGTVLAVAIRRGRAGHGDRGAESLEPLAEANG